MVFSSRNVLEDSSNLLCTSSRLSETLVLISEIDTLNFPSTPSLLENITESFSMSRGPISIRKGTPFNSHSLNLNPGDMLSLSST